MRRVMLAMSPAQLADMDQLKRNLAYRFGRLSRRR
jgi:hypothetical protein